MNGRLRLTSDPCNVPMILVETALGPRRWYELVFANAVGLAAPVRAGQASALANTAYN